MAIPFISCNDLYYPLTDCLPSYAHKLGLEYSSAVLDLHSYSFTNRDMPSTSLTWNLQNINKTERDTLWYIWYYMFQRGVKLFTICDNKKRFLFNSFWSDWKEKWSKKRGGVYDSILDITSPFPWTMPCYAFYPFIESNALGFGCHSRDTASTLVISGNGSYIDSKTLRYVESVSPSYAAGITGLEWFQQKDSSSISIMFQFCCGEIAAGATIDIARLYSTDMGSIRIYAKKSASWEMTIGMGWYGDGNIEESITEIASMNIPSRSGNNLLWYDICGTINAMNNFASLYVCKCPGIEYSIEWSYSDDFLYGTSSIATSGNSLSSKLSATNLPEDLTWTDLYLLTASHATVYTDSNYPAKIRNVFIGDDFMPPMEYNWMRRIYQYWNTQTGDNPK